MMMTEQPTEQQIRNTFGLKKHQEIEGVKKCDARGADAEIQRIIAEAEAEGYEVKIRRNGNQIHIDKVKKDTGDKIIDGHFWVEHQGKNKDLTTDALVEKMKRNGHRCVYLPAPQPQAEEFITMVYDRLKTRHLAKGGLWEEWIEEVEDMYDCGELGSFDCVQGAMVLKKKLGDGAKIIYGQVGALRPDGMIHWFFGHPDETPDLWEKLQGNSMNKPGYCSHLTPASRFTNLIYDPRTPASVKKQKPNEKCLCGSGKKFKVCCGKCF
jgi:hypothetical protein